MDRLIGRGPLCLTLDIGQDGRTFSSTPRCLAFPDCCGGEFIMRCDRRSFVNRSLAVAGALMTGAATSEAAPETDPRNTELLSRMRWMNEPASYKIRGETMVVHSRSKTDFWRKTFYGYITDNGHFFYLEATGDFTFQARFNGQYAALYD
jgi:hypothetical protein